MKETQDSTTLVRLMRGAWALLAMVLIFAVGIFLSVLSLTSGSSGVEIAALVLLGLAGGGLVRGLVRENFMTAVFISLLVAECALLSQFSEPWSSLWPTLIPANAIGLMLGNVARQGLLESRPKIRRDVWVVNGTEYSRTEDAKAASLGALSTWDSTKAGRFFVERNEGLFEAVGNRATGFIVHCAAKSEDENEWRILGALDGGGETEIRIPSGAAYAPSGVVVDLEVAKAALLGFFHYRGPDPALEWTADKQVLDLKFG